jgi:hypothetical protein
MPDDCGADGMPGWIAHRVFLRFGWGRMGPKRVELFAAIRFDWQHNLPDRQDRRRQGKSDPFDAVSAARAALSGRARGASKGLDGAVEVIRAAMVAKRSAAGERTHRIDTHHQTQSHALAA